MLQTPFNRFRCAADQAARRLETPQRRAGRWRRKSPSSKRREVPPHRPCGRSRSPSRPRPKPRRPKQREKSSDSWGGEERGEPAKTNREGNFGQILPASNEGTRNKSAFKRARGIIRGGRPQLHQDAPICVTSCSFVVPSLVRARGGNGPRDRIRVKSCPSVVATERSDTEARHDPIAWNRSTVSSERPTAVSSSVTAAFKNRGRHESPPAVPVFSTIRGGRPRLHQDAPIRVPSCSFVVYPPVNDRHPKFRSFALSRQAEAPVFPLSPRQGERQGRGTPP